MAANKGELFSASDFTTLKNLVKNEINRRSNSKSVGSMSAYNGSSYNYTTTPAKGGNINLEHIQKITKPLDAVNGGNLTPNANTNVYATQITTATSIVSSLSSKSVTASSMANTGCKSSCSGLCYTGCYSGCNGCSGGCSGSCSGGCDDTCDGMCDVTCASQLMSGNCMGGCYENCDGGTCTADCGGSCGNHKFLLS